MSAGPDRRFPATAFSAVRRAQSATSDVPCRHLVQPDRVRSNTDGQDRFHRASVKRRGFHAPERLPSTGAPKTPYLRMDAQEPATVLGGVAISEPASGDLLRSPLNARQVPTCVVLRRFVPGRPAPPGVQSLRPGRWQIRYAACQLLQSPRFLSTTMDLTDTPRAPPRVTPLRCV